MLNNKIKCADLFEGVSADTVELLGGILAEVLEAAMNSIEGSKYVPARPLIMNAFRLCPIEAVRVVILGQDPYIHMHEAMGLSFSVPRGVKVPPSLVNIYKCLIHCGLMGGTGPDHGDLTHWARQGVLLLNCALTTVEGQSNAHSAIWHLYTDAIIYELSQLGRGIIFILLGKFAAKKSVLISGNNTVLKWGHPSPLNRANQRDTPKHFKYCDVFVRANTILKELGGAPITWDVRDYIVGPIPIMVTPAITANLCGDSLLITQPMSIRDPVVLTEDILWAFTDGGASKNGSRDCRAAWAFYISDGMNISKSYGVLTAACDGDVITATTNNRGELTAILNCLQHINCMFDKFKFKKICIMSDSKYSIKCITEWISSWLERPKDLATKKNVDLIVDARRYYDSLCSMFDVEFLHIHSHKKEPSDRSSQEWFGWKCNTIVDLFCNIALGRKSHALFDTY